MYTGFSKPEARKVRKRLEAIRRCKPEDRPSPINIKNRFESFLKDATIRSFRPQSTLDSLNKFKKQSEDLEMNPTDTSGSSSARGPNTDQMVQLDTEYTDIKPERLGPFPDLVFYLKPFPGENKLRTLKKIFDDSPYGPLIARSVPVGTMFKTQIFCNGKCMCEATSQYKQEANQAAAIKFLNNLRATNYFIEFKKSYCPKKTIPHHVLHVDPSLSHIYKVVCLQSPRGPVFPHPVDLTSVDCVSSEEEMWQYIKQHATSESKADLYALNIRKFRRPIVQGICRYANRKLTNLHGCSDKGLVISRTENPREILYDLLRCGGENIKYKLYPPGSSAQDDEPSKVEDNNKRANEQSEPAVQNDEISILPWIADHLVIMDLFDQNSNLCPPREILFCAVRDCPELQEFIIEKKTNKSTGVITAEALIDRKVVARAEAFTDKLVKTRAAENAIKNLLKCCKYIQGKDSYFGLNGHTPLVLCNSNTKNSKIYRVVDPEEFSNVRDHKELLRKFRFSPFEDLYFLENISHNDRNKIMQLAEELKFTVRKFCGQLVCVSKPKRIKEIFKQLMLINGNENEKYKLIFPQEKLNQQLEISNLTSQDQRKYLSLFDYKKEDIKIPSALPHSSRSLSSKMVHSDTFPKANTQHYDRGPASGISPHLRFDNRDANNQRQLTNKASFSPTIETNPNLSTLFDVRKQPEECSQMNQRFDVETRGHQLDSWNKNRQDSRQTSNPGTAFQRPFQQEHQDDNNLYDPWIEEMGNRGDRFDRDQDSSRVEPSWGKEPYNQTPSVRRQHEMDVFDKNTNFPQSMNQTEPSFSQEPGHPREREMDVSGGSIREARDRAPSQQSEHAWDRTTQQYSQDSGSWQRRDPGMLREEVDYRVSTQQVGQQSFSSFSTSARIDNRDSRQLRNSEGDAECWVSGGRRPRTSSPSSAEVVSREFIQKPWDNQETTSLERKEPSTSSSSQRVVHYRDTNQHITQQPWSDESRAEYGRKGTGLSSPLVKGLGFEELVRQLKQNIKQYGNQEEIVDYRGNPTGEREHLQIMQEQRDLQEEIAKRRERGHSTSAGTNFMESNLQTQEREDMRAWNKGEHWSKNEDSGDWTRKVSDHSDELLNYGESNQQFGGPMNSQEQGDRSETEFYTSHKRYAANTESAQRTNRGFSEMINEMEFTRREQHSSEREQDYSKSGTNIGYEETEFRGRDHSSFLEREQGYSKSVQYINQKETREFRGRAYPSLNYSEKEGDYTKPRQHVGQEETREFREREPPISAFSERGQDFSKSRKLIGQMLDRPDESGSWKERESNFYDIGSSSKREDPRDVQGFPRSLKTQGADNFYPIGQENSSPLGKEQNNHPSKLSSLFDMAPAKPSTSMEESVTKEYNQHTCQEPRRYQRKRSRSIDIFDRRDSFKRSTPPRTPDQSRRGRKKPFRQRPDRSRWETSPKRQREMTWNKDNKKMYDQRSKRY